jgi:hypothetical protein
MSFDRAETVRTMDAHSLTQPLETAVYAAHP